MALNAPTISLGTTLAYKSGTFISILQLTKVSTSPEVGTGDSTSLSSAAKECVPTIVDFGEISFEGNYSKNDASKTFLTGLLTTPVVTEWKITYPDSSFEQFFGVLTGYEKNSEIDSIITVSGTIKISGAVTFA